MKARTETAPSDETLTTRDRTLTTCRPAQIEPDAPAPEEWDTADPERNIVRGDD